MKIYYQLNNNDCGIAVTQSLIYHFFNREVSREELYQESNIREDGISILDLEQLNSKYGIRMESYSMSFQEFLDHETDDYFLLVINREGENHYTIARKRGKSVTLYDPSLGKIRVEPKELERLWTNIFIRIFRDPEPAPKRAKFRLRRDEIDLRKISSIFLVNASVLLLSIVNTYLTKYSLSHVFSNHDFSNLLKILAINLLVLGAFYAGEWLESLLIFRQRNQLVKEMYRGLLRSLNTKRNSYFQKLGRNQFLIVRDHIHYIASYHAEHLNRWFTAAFTFIVISLFLIWLSPYFIVFILSAMAIQVLFWRCSKEAYQRHVPRLNEIQNEGKRLMNSLEGFLQNEVNAPSSLGWSNAARTT